MKMLHLASVRGSIVWDAMWCRVVVPIFLGLIRSSFTAQTVMIYTVLRAAAFRESMVRVLCFPCRILRTDACLRDVGAFFGTTFAHLFFQSYRELAPAPFWKPSSSTESSLSPGRSPDSGNSSQRSPFINPNLHGGQKRPEGRVYEPRIYGFKVSERAKSGPRMQWLRLRPQSPEELDMVDWRGRWIDDEEYGDVDEEEEGDKQMEDFDPVRPFFRSMAILFTVIR